MHRLARDPLQLRHPLPDILALGVELLALQQGVEDAEVGLGVDAGAGAEAPAAVVGGEVAVDEVLHEVALAEAPVEQEVLGQEAGDDHPAPVVHVGRVVELPHRGVHDRVPCAAGAPGREERRGVLPGDVGVFGFEGLVHAAGEEEGLADGGVGTAVWCEWWWERDLPDVGPVREHMLVKVPPGNFGDPVHDAGVAAVQLLGGVGVASACDGGSGAQCPGCEMHA